jgi:hypothetical protein
MDFWRIEEHGGGKTFAKSKEEVMAKLTKLSEDRGPWYIEKMKVCDPDGTWHVPEVSATGEVSLREKAAGKRR